MYILYTCTTLGWTFCVRFFVILQINDLHTREFSTVSLLISQWGCSKSDGGAAGKLHRRQCFTSTCWCPQVNLETLFNICTSALIYIPHIYTYISLIFRCIVRALKDPNTFLIDHLLTLKPVRFLEGELIHDVSTEGPVMLCGVKYIKDITCFGQYLLEISTLITSHTVLLNVITSC